MVRLCDCALSHSLWSLSTKHKFRMFRNIIFEEFPTKAEINHQAMMLTEMRVKFLKSGTSIVLKEPTYNQEVQEGS